MATLALRSVRKAFGQEEVVKGIDLEAADGEFLVFVGPSGCGKSTLLRLIAGLEDPTDGDVEIGGARVNDLAPSERGIAMVFQSYALYPHMTVFDNMAFGLKLSGTDRSSLTARVQDAARILRIDHLLGRRPRELSGGQRQRVAIGRAIVREPAVFLFDEPLSNLDAALRVDMRLELARLHERLGATMVYVTHDQVEAMTLADRIAVINAGRLEQAGRPLDLYRSPANRFVAGFIGSPRMNFVGASISSVNDGHAAAAMAAGSTVNLPIAQAVTLGSPATLGIRPEHLTLGDEGDLLFAGQVRMVERLGAASLVHLTLSSGEDLVVQQAGDTRVRAGDQATAACRIGDCHLFNADGQRISDRDPA